MASRTARRKVATKARARRRRANPELVLVLGNPGRGPVQGAQLMSRKVEQLEYVHVEEQGQDVVRFHPFGRSVEMWALPGGEILLRHAKGKPLWAEF